MKILVISPFSIFPPYWGGASRIYNLVKCLAKNNNIIFLYNDYKQAEFSIDCEEYKYISSNQNIKVIAVKPINSLKKFSQIFNPFLILKGLRTIKKEKPDLVLAELAWSGLNGIVFHFLTHIAYIIDEHNIEFLRFRRLRRGGKLVTFLLKQYEKQSCKFAYKVFCVSDVDRDFLISRLSINKNKIIVIPNGVDMAKFYASKEKKEKIRRELDIDNKTYLITFFGRWKYKPNYEAIEIIYTKLLPKVLKKVQNMKFFIIGDSPSMKFQHENIIFTGVVDKIEDYINASDIIICPLKSGGGTRIKILESIACGKTVVTTSIGAEGLINEQTRVFLRIADDWDKFVDEIVDTLKNPESDDIPIEFIKRYSWGNIGKIICEET